MYMSRKEKEKMLKELNLCCKYHDEDVVAYYTMSNFGIPIDSFKQSEDGKYYYFDLDAVQYYGSVGNVDISRSRSMMPRDISYRKGEKLQVLKSRLKYYKWFLILNFHIFLSLYIYLTEGRTDVFYDSAKIFIAFFIAFVCSYIIKKNAYLYPRALYDYSVLSLSYAYRWRLEDEINYQKWEESDYSDEVIKY